MDQDNPNNNQGNSSADKSRQAAADIIRGQLQRIYDKKEGIERPSQESTPAPAIESSSAAQPSATTKDPAQGQESKARATNMGPYERTYSQGSPQIKQKEWSEYQSAWQDYYQKYYEKYYTQQYQAAQKAINRQKAGIIASRKAYQNTQSKRVVTGNTTNTPTASVQSPINKAPAPIRQNVETNTKPVAITEEEATQKLRRRIQNTIKRETTRVRKSRHFMPFVTATAAIFLFLFLQFNQLLISNVVAYVSPGSIDPQNIVIDTPQNIEVDPSPKLIIPKINVDVPVHYDIGADTASQNAAMRDGLAHFSIPGANSHPGEIGNTVIAGHSSGDLFMNSQYKFIFAQLHKLEVGDKIYAHYNGKRYTYAITRMETVYPNEVNKLIYDTQGKPVMTLITCTPLGTSLQRLLVTAEQISPDPLKATAAPLSDDSSTASIPGNEPTWITKLFNKLFGID